VQTESDEILQYLAARKREGEIIDPETAEVRSFYVQTMDPYGVGGIPPELEQVGSAYFARNQNATIWVWFGDLPDNTREKLEHKHELGTPSVLLRALLDRLGRK
jgi:hypothetical protein